MAEVWVTAAATVAAAGIGAYASSSNAKKARKANSSALAAGDEAGAFQPLTIPKPQELKVPPAPEILAAWRGEVNTNFPEYDQIAGKLNVSEQDAARVANEKANPQYYSALDQITNNALAASRGQIPKDVQQNILRSANEDSYLRGFNYGTPSGGSKSFAGGNDAAANLALRNLGLTSLDLMKYGNQLTGSVLEQSRAGRGSIISAKDTTPTPQIFQDQMNASAIAQYNYATDKAGYTAATANAPIQAAYNRLALQMGVSAQNSALSAQTGAQNTQLAVSALQALGQMYGGSSTIGGNVARTNTAAQPTQYPNAFGVDSAFGDQVLMGSSTGPSTAYQPISSASTLRGTV